MSDELDKYNASAERQNRLACEAQDEIEQLRDALRLIAEFGGKTLILASDDPHERQAYSLGANRAFGQCAGIATDALRMTGTNI